MRQPSPTLCTMLNQKLCLFTNVVVVLNMYCAAPALAGDSLTLFERLGGMEQIAAVVSETIDRTSEDPRVSRVFEGIKLAPVKESVAQHLCEISGGPCKYEGATIIKAHTGLAITSEHFEIMDSYLAQALSGRGVSQTDGAELGKLLNAMKGDVIDR